MCAAADAVVEEVADPLLDAFVVGNSFFFTFSFLFIEEEDAGADL